MGTYMGETPESRKDRNLGPQGGVRVVRSLGKVAIRGIVTDPTDSQAPAPQGDEPAGTEDVSRPFSTES